MIYSLALVCILGRVFEQLVDRMLLAIFSIFYDGLSFQYLATVLISVFTLCYGPELLFRGSPCSSPPGVALLHNTTLIISYVVFIGV